MYDYIISLGCRCVTRHHLDRHKLVKESFPFDHSNTDLPMLLKMFKTDFSGVFQKDVIVICQTTYFRFAHQPVRELGEIRKRLMRRIQRLRSVRHKRLLFIRQLEGENVGPIDTLVARHLQLYQALANYMASRTSGSSPVSTGYGSKSMPTSIRYRVATRRTGTAATRPGTSSST